MNYLSFFSLRQEPFSNAPVSRFYFNSEQHARALVRMMFAIENMKGLAVLAGNIGAGKSTTARRILESLPEDRYEVALMVMVQSGVSPHWFLTKIAYQLGVTQPAEDKTRLLGQLYRRLYALHQAGRNAVVLVDEAQMLDSRELMEEIRGLLNMEIPEKKLLTLCLFGLPEMEEHLKLDPPLYQRIAVRARLGPLAPDGTEAYIKHRLRLAGARRMLFTQEAVQSIHRATRGVPRLINTVCDNALFEGFLSRVNPITSKVVEAVVAELGYDGVTELGGAEVASATPVAPRVGASPGASMGWDAGRDFRGAPPRAGRGAEERSAVEPPRAAARPRAEAPPAPEPEDAWAPSQVDAWVEEARAWGQRDRIDASDPGEPVPADDEAEATEPANQVPGPAPEAPPEVPASRRIREETATVASRFEAELRALERSAPTPAPPAEPLTMEAALADLPPAPSRDEPASASGEGAGVEEAGAASVLDSAASVFKGWMPGRRAPEPQEPAWRRRAQGGDEGPGEEPAPAVTTAEPAASGPAGWFRWRGKR